MRLIIKVGFLLCACSIGWFVGGRLSSDALGMLLGCILGLMVGIPTALIAMSVIRNCRVEQHIHYHVAASAAPQFAPPVRRVPTFIVVSEQKRIEVQNEQ